ncbi:MAG: ATPase [Proteobacteria bacterium]|jgi:uncharacterized membrane protein YraQ (UPF0718 family)|nr:permease [Alphaproteobacteria bacterium]NCC03639.1 ATPase [Pseudomonadota bacterium]
MKNCCSSEEKKKQAETAMPSCCAHKGPRPDFLFWGTSLAVAALYGLSFVVAPDLLPWLSTMATTTQEMVHSVWWGVLVGFVFVGILSKIPRNFIMAIFGRGGTVKGLLRATGAGVLLDLCSHGILMVGVRLYERGASLGQVIAFLMASPWNSLSLTLILIGLIGLPWTLAFIVLSMIIALVTGWIFDRLVERGVLPCNPNSEQVKEDFNFWPEAKKEWSHLRLNGKLLREMVANGARDSQMVLRWLFVGILLAALLRAFVPADAFGHYFGPTFMGLVFTLILTTIIEVCSEGSAPIAADIFTRAAAPGNAFAFLMAGVATDYTEIMVLKDVTKSWKIALFLPLISVPQIVLVGWIINSFALH